MGSKAITPKRACRKCYGHAINLGQALEAGGYLVAPTGTVHKPNNDVAGKTECGQDISGGWDDHTTVATTTVATDEPTNEQGLTASGRRPRLKHRPPSGRRP